MESEFEKKLQRQPMRAIPAEWRNEIAHPGRFAPKASWWAGLAAVWALILYFNFSTASPQRGGGSAEQLANSFIEQKRDVAHLLEALAPNVVPAPASQPGRRSQRLLDLLFV